ncbi:MAG: DUF4926 domain-containing protein [Pseudanabaena sp.]
MAKNSLKSLSYFNVRLVNNQSKFLFFAFLLDIVYSCPKGRKNIQFGGQICFKVSCSNRLEYAYWGLKLKLKSYSGNYQDEFPKPRKIQLKDIVALRDDLPSHGLSEGHVGNIVQLFNGGSICRVRFITPEGRDYAYVILRQDQLMVLRFYPDSYLVS